VWKEGSFRWLPDRLYVSSGRLSRWHPVWINEVVAVKCSRCITDCKLPIRDRATKVHSTHEEGVCVCVCEDAWVCECVCVSAFALRVVVVVNTERRRGGKKK
jgi:hypothetical protein